MNQRDLAELIHEQTAAIAALEVRISTHEAILRTLRVLALEEITLGQAIGILTKTAEHSTDPELQVRYWQATASLWQIQAEEP
jgi:hypothetical protein